MRGTELLLLAVKMGLPSVQTLTMFRTPSLQSCPHGCSGGYRSRVHSLCGRGATRFWNRFEKGTSRSRQWEKLAIHGCSSTSPREELHRNVVVRGLEKASDDFDTTNFFLDELIEAKLILEKLEEAENSTDSFHPWQDERISERNEDEDKSPENLDICQGSESSRLGKLPLESNGPPMAILQPYLKADNAREQAKDRLPLLPLPLSHKSRPAGLPRPSLRRRLGIAYSRKLASAGEESDSLADI